MKVIPKRCKFNRPEDTISGSQSIYSCWILEKSFQTWRHKTDIFFVTSIKTAFLQF